MLILFIISNNIIKFLRGSWVWFKERERGRITKDIKRDRRVYREKKDKKVQFNFSQIIAQSEFNQKKKERNKEIKREIKWLTLFHKFRRWTSSLARARPCAASSPSSSRKTFRKSNKRTVLLSREPEKQTF